MSNKNKAHKPVEEEITAEHFSDDEIVHVPKGQNRKTFLLTLGLTIFVLLIFTVGDVFSSVAGGGGGGQDPVAMSFTDPATGTEREVKSLEFNATKRRLQRLWEFGFYQPLSIGTQRPKIEDEDAALWFVLDSLAEKEGVEVSTAEFVKGLKARGMSKETMEANAARLRTSVAALEKDLYLGLRAAKLKDLLVSSSALIADPAEVASRWMEQNPQYKFQLVELKAEDFEEEAKANPPSDEELEAWFDERPAFEQQKRFTEEKIAPSVAWVDLTSTDFDATGLLEKYPLPADWDAEAKAESTTTASPPCASACPRRRKSSRRVRPPKRARLPRRRDFRGGRDL